MLSLVVLHAAKTTPQTASLAPNPAETVSDLPLSNGYFRPTPHCQKGQSANAGGDADAARA